MQDIARKLGARFGEGNFDNAFWTPVSIRQRADGSTASFPHFVMDRSKPGTVCVDQSGRRFVNESVSYHVFGRAMFDWVSPAAPKVEDNGLLYLRDALTSMPVAVLVEDGVPRT